MLLRRNCSQSTVAGSKQSTGQSSRSPINLPPPAYVEQATWTALSNSVAEAKPVDRRNNCSSADLVHTLRIMSSARNPKQESEAHISPSLLL